MRRFSSCLTAARLPVFALAASLSGVFCAGALGAGCSQSSQPLPIYDGGALPDVTVSEGGESDAAGDAPAEGATPDASVDAGSKDGSTDDAAHDGATGPDGATPPADGGAADAEQSG